MEKRGKYWNLSMAAGAGSMLGSGIIVGLASTITVFQEGLKLTNGQVGVISGALTFAIAFGSIFGARLADKVGLIGTFNWINLLYAIGAAIIMFSPNYATMLIGVIVTGIASGTDLPVSLSVISRDAPSKEKSSQMVASTQIFWQIGQFVSTGAAFIVSTMSVTGGRIVFGVFVVISLIIWLWRTSSRTLRGLHAEAGQRIEKNEEKENKEDKQVSIMSVLFHGEHQKMYRKIFFVVLIYYVFWNLIANTWGQFTTFTLVKAGASQTLSTGIGLGLHIAALFILAFYVRIAGSAQRNTWFKIGAVFALVAMGGLAIFGSDSVAMIVVFMLLWGVGSMLSGEAIYKVWTQESFPVEVRASIQGFINGFSRFICGLFAMITPVLVLPQNIKGTMWGFVLVVVIFSGAGLVMMGIERTYHILDKDKK